MHIHIISDINNPLFCLFYLSDVNLLEVYTILT